MVDDGERDVILNLGPRREAGALRARATIVRSDFPATTILHPSYNSLLNQPTL